MHYLVCYEMLFTFFLQYHVCHDEVLLLFQFEEGDSCCTTFFSGATVATQVDRRVFLLICAAVAPTDFVDRRSLLCEVVPGVHGS